MKHNAKNICKTVINSKELNLKKQMAEFVISILFQYFMHILAKFSTLNTEWWPAGEMWPATSFYVAREA